MHGSHKHQPGCRKIAKLEIVCGISFVKSKLPEGANEIPSAAILNGGGAVINRHTNRGNHDFKPGFTGQDALN